MIPMLTFYLMVLILIGMIWYAGYEGTMRIFAYWDLNLRYAWIRVRMWQMKRRLERDLPFHPSDLSSVLEDIKNGK